MQKSLLYKKSFVFAIYWARLRTGVTLMLSNSNSKFIRKLYREFRIETVKARRSINCDASKRGGIIELVILNY